VVKRWTMIGVALLATTVLSACNRFGYDANIDSVAVDGGLVTVSGWLHDALPNRADRCPALRLSIDGGQQITSGICPTFAHSRPDVDATLGGTNASLPGWPIPALGAGTHRFCIDAVPAASASAPFSPLSCRDVVIAFDQFDHSAIDTITASGSSIDVAGWYSHVIRTSTQRLDIVTWTLDGLLIADIGNGPTFTAATVVRPDAQAAFGPTAVGQTLHIDGVAAGSHEVCLGLKSPWFTSLSGVITCRRITV